MADKPITGMDSSYPENIRLTGARRWRFSTCRASGRDFASGREVVLEPTKDQTFITFVGK